MHNETNQPHPLPALPLEIVSDVPALKRPAPAQARARPGLVFCLAMDAIGMFTYLIPGLGEFADVIWAPISGLVFYAVFRHGFGACFAFAEEALPGTDFIPTFTLAWFFLRRSNPSATHEQRT